MKSIADDRARQVLPPSDLFTRVLSLIIHSDPDQYVDEERSWVVAPVRAKVGRAGTSFGLRARFGATNPQYITVVARENGNAAVESNYLTYYRTAALGLVGPWLSHGPRVRRVVVIGHGKLAHAVRDLSGTVWPAAETSQVAHGESDIDVATDVVVAATSARSALPSLMSSRCWPWLVLLGSVKRREELEASPSARSGRTWYSDAPPIAHERGLATHARPLSAVESAERHMRRQGAVVCGGGHIDVELACAVLESEEDE